MMRANAIAILAAAALASACGANKAPAAPVEREFRVDGMRRINGAL